MLKQTVDKKFVGPLVFAITALVASVNLLVIALDFLRGYSIPRYELVSAVVLLLGTFTLWLYLHSTQKKAHRSKIASEEQFRRLFVDAPIGMVIVGMDRRVRHANQAFCEFSGYSAEELVGQPISLLSPNEDRGQVDSEIRRILEGKVRSVQFQKRYVKKDSEIVWGQVSVTTVDYQEDRALFAMVVNITERKKAELALISMNEILEERVSLRSRELSERAELLAASELSLRSQTQLLQLILDSIADGVAMCDPQGKLILFNRGAEQIYGFNLKEVSPVNWAKDFGIFHADRVTHLNHDEIPLMRAIRGEVVNDAELFITNYKRPEGFYVMASARPVWDEEGLLRGGVVVFRDITRAKIAEEQMRRSNEKMRLQTMELYRSNQDLEQFAYVASHDLKEPLRMVSSYVQLLQRRYRGKLDKDADDFIKFAVDGVKRMHHLIEDLLAYSHVNRHPEKYGLVDGMVILETVKRDLGSLIQESGAEITSGQLPRFYADEMQVHQLFLNLIGNALKYRTERPPRIHIDARPAESANGWIFSVSDNGIGIKPEYRERIFNLFQRLHTKEEYPGTGIGLAICKKIVERHQGQIWVDSKVGEGSTFYVLLPQPEAIRPIPLGDIAESESTAPSAS